jgi:hypothetical protein
LPICANCGTTLLGEYCHACGQRRFVESDRGFGHLLHLFVGSITDLDGRVWRTVRALLFHPGLLSREYFEGRRARWISPVSLFLAISVVYFLAPFHGGDLTAQFNQQVSGRVRALAGGPDEKLSAAQLAGAGQAHTPFTERWVDERVRVRDEAARKSSGGATGYSYRDYRVAYDAKADDISKALVILHVPFAAFALMLVFVRQRRYFAEHFVVALHFFSFAMVALEVVLQGNGLINLLLPAAWQPPSWSLDWLMRTLLPAYAIISLRRAYGVGWAYAVAAACVMLATVVMANLYFYRTVQFLVTFALT